MKDFRDLQVWQKAHELVLSIYRESMTLPADERYGLTGQLRRAAISIPANIAEGCGRGGDREFARFLQIALGSSSELEYLLLLARELDLMNATTHLQLEQHTIEVKRMLTGLVRKLNADR